MIHPTVGRLQHQPSSGARYLVGYGATHSGYPTHPASVHRPTHAPTHHRLCAAASLRKTPQSNFLKGASVIKMEVKAIYALRHLCARAATRPWHASFAPVHFDHLPPRPPYRREVVSRWCLHAHRQRRQLVRR